MAVGSSRPEASTPWPRRVMVIRRSRVTSRPDGSNVPTSRRTELVPHVDGRHRRAAHGPTWGPTSGSTNWAATHAPTGSSPPARYQA